MMAQTQSHVIVDLDLRQLNVENVELGNMLSVSDA